MGSDWTFEATDVKSGRLQRIGQRWPHTEPATDPLHNDGSEWKAPFDSPLDCDERLYRCPDGSLVLVWKVDESNSYYHCDYVYRCEPMNESEGREWCERQGFGLPDQLRPAEHDAAPALKNLNYRSLWDFGRGVESALNCVMRAACNLCCDEFNLERDADAPAIGAAVAELDAVMRAISDVDDWINTPNGADQLVNTLFAIQSETRSLIIKVGHSLRPLTWNGDFKKLSLLQDFLAREIAGLASIPELECELHAEALRKLQAPAPAPAAADGAAIGVQVVSPSVIQNIERRTEPDGTVSGTPLALRTFDALDAGAAKPASSVAGNAGAVEPESKAAIAAPAKRTLKKVSKSEADKLARAYLDKQPWPGQNELARIINYWPQRMAELPAVKDYRKEHPDVEPAHSPKAVGISDANEAAISVGEPHGVLNAMIAKEEAEQELKRLAMEKVTEIVKTAQEQAAEHRADFAPRKFRGNPIGRRRKA